MTALLLICLLAGDPRPGLFAERPAAFAETPKAAGCFCRDCKCDVCRCEPLAVIGCIPVAHDSAGRVKAAGMTCYQTARALAVADRRPLVVIIGATPPSLASHAGDNPVIYCAAADPLFPRPGLYRYDHKPAGLMQTVAPGATAAPRCANGKCNLR